MHHEGTISLHPQFAIVGVRLLLHSDVVSTEAVCALFFMAFSAVKLLETSMAFGIERSAKQSGNLRMAPEYERRIKLDETETVVLELQENQESACIAGTPHWPVIEHILDDKPRLRSLYERILPSISFRGYAVETVLVVLSCSCILSGVGQSFASSGPPRIIAYNMMDLSKGAIRGLNGILLFANLQWMCVFFCVSNSLLQFSSVMQ
jgi:hypothetical protein